MLWEWEGKLRKAQQTGLEQVGKYKCFNIFIELFLQRDLLHQYIVFCKGTCLSLFSVCFTCESCLTLLTNSTKEDQNFKQR